jgi:hypothetical protein
MSESLATTFDFLYFFATLGVFHSCKNKVIIAIYTLEAGSARMALLMIVAGA